MRWNGRSMSTAPLPAGPHPLAAGAAADGPWGAAAGPELVRVFEEDPGLLGSAEGAVAERLRRLAVAPAHALLPGPCDLGALHCGEPEEGCLGLLVLDGVLVRTLRVQGRELPELV